MPTTKRTPGEGSLYKRADGYWVASVEVPSADGRRSRKTVSSRDRGTAARKLQALQAKARAGAAATSSRATVAQWLEHWLETIHGPEVRPTTYDSYEQAIRIHIVPVLGARRIDQLSLEDIRTMHRAVQQRSTRAAQKAHQVLQRALADAVAEGIIDRNVAQLARKPKHAKVAPDALDADSARRLIRYAIDSGDPHASRWAAAFFTGARQSELLGLTWDRTDLDAGLIDLSWQLQQLKKTHGCGDPDPEGVYPCGRRRPGYCPKALWRMPPGFEHRACYRSLVWTRPKTSAGTRLVPLAAPLLMLLREHRAATPDTEHNLVWTHADGRPVGPHDDHEHWRALLSGAGFGEPLPGLHAARHTTATLLLIAGVPEQIRMQIMGQSSVVAHRGYLHVSQDLARDAVAVLSPLID